MFTISSKIDEVRIDGSLSKLRQDLDSFQKIGLKAVELPVHGYDLEAAVQTLGDFIAHTHIHDNFGGAVHHWEKQQTRQLSFGRGDSHMPVGRGKVPVGPILDILLPGYTGLLMMELRSRYFDEIQESKQNLEALITLLNSPAALI